MKILITGAGGFLGQKLKTHLASKHTVDAFTRSEFDLTDSEQVCEVLGRNFYDIIVHCAASGRNNLFSVDPAIVTNNLEAFANLLAYRKQYYKLINIASGAEFDLSQDIHRAREEQIWQRFPAQSYGRSKNLIARLVSNTRMSQNLRLFGCFDSDEDERRLLKIAHHSLSKQEKFTIKEDREFDMVSFNDFARVVEMACLGQISEPDVNVVYAQKYRLSEILKLYCYEHGFDRNLIEVTGSATNNYSGNGSLLSKYQTNFEGLHQAISQYKVKV